MKLVRSGAENLAEQVGFPGRNVEQIGFAGGLVMRGGGFEEMAGVIKFMALLRVIQPAFRAVPPVGMLGVNRADGVEVAVRFLRGGEEANQMIEVSRYFRVGLDSQRIGGAFEDLVRIGVVERKPRQLAVGDAFAAQDRRGACEIVHAAGLLAFPERVRNRDGAIGFEARRPENVVQVNGGEWHRTEGIIVRAGGGGQMQTGKGEKKAGKKTAKGRCGLHKT